MKIAIYARKSRTTDKGDSIENQIALCKQYASFHFSDPEFDEYKDEGYSGSNINRPAFQELIKSIRKGSYEILICYRLDRISRNVLDFSSTLEMLTKNGVAFVSIKENFDTTTPMGRAMLHISSVFAQLERETIAERIRDNMLELSKTGRWLGGTVPIGYTSKKIKCSASIGNGKNFTILQVDSNTASIVTTLFHKYLQFGSLSQLTVYLQNKNIKTLNDKFFHPHVLKNILSNPVYCAADQKVYKYFSTYNSFIANPWSDFDGQYGLMVYNKNRQGKSIYKNNISEWIVAIGKHEPLINSEIWLKTQERLAKNTIQRISHNQSSHALLSGLLYCSKCGAHMNVTNQTILKDGSVSYIYRCSSKHKSHGKLCNIANAKGHFLDKAVFSKVTSILLSETSIIKRLVKQREHILLGDSEVLKEETQIKEQIKKYEKAINKIFRLMSETEDNLLDGAYKKEIDRLESMLHVLKSELAEVHNKKLQTCEATDAINNAANITETLLKHIDEIPLIEKRMLIEEIVNYIEWDGSSVNVYLYKNIGDFESSKRNS
jgi:site-specific DNA recombinase